MSLLVRCIFPRHIPLQGTENYKLTRVKKECINSCNGGREGWLSLGLWAMSLVHPVASVISFQLGKREPVPAWLSGNLSDSRDSSQIWLCLPLPWPGKPTLQPLLKATSPPHRPIPMDNLLAGFSAKSGAYLCHRGLTRCLERLKFKASHPNNIAMPNSLP